MTASVLVPLCLYAYTRHKIQSGLVPALAAAALEPVHIGTVELSLFGTLRVEDLTIGESLSAQELEASVGMQTLMRGDFAPDEVRVVRPRVRARMNPDGSLDLSELLARLRRTRAKSSVAAVAPAPRRPRAHPDCGASWWREASSWSPCATSACWKHPTWSYGRSAVACEWWRTGCAPIW